jgi:hypothetical protein
MFNENEYQNNNFSFINAVPSQLCPLIDIEDRALNMMITYMEFDDLINLRVTCKAFRKRINRTKVKQTIRDGVITQKTRKNFWMSNIDYKTMEEIIRKELFIDLKENVYDRVQLLKNNERTNNQKFFKVCDEVEKDLYRTFHFGKFTTQEGQDELGRILMAIAYIRPEIGYCQGMNFVAGSILYFIDNEELTFWIFLALLDSLELNSLYYRVSKRLIYRTCRIIA